LSDAIKPKGLFNHPEKESNIKKIGRPLKSMHIAKSDSHEVTNVILAEDDQDDVLIFKLALNSLPIAVELRHADDGEKLFILLKQLIPDILFLDINLPCKDGIACIVEIRRNKEYNEVPVIMYTSYKSKEYINDSFENGANFYLIKANSVEKIAEKLRVIFSIDWKKFMYYPPKSQFVIDTK
jgi:CheY-like chemotaxis protein